MDALLDRLRVVRAFDISRVMSVLVAYIDGATGEVRETALSLLFVVVSDQVNLATKTPFTPSSD